MDRLLIDECLSPKLITVAHEAGFECTCSRDRGLLGIPDWRLIACVITGDFILVTNNAVDFRGNGLLDPGGLYSRLEIHPGLICLYSTFQMTFVRQCTLFERALTKLSQLPDLINQVLEVSEDATGSVSDFLYKNPKS